MPLYEGEVSREGGNVYPCAKSGGSRRLAVDNNRLLLTQQIGLRRIKCITVYSNPFFCSWFSRSY